MTATTMHFGPEWMRTKQAPSRPNPSPPLASPATGTAPAGTSSYSALVTPASQPPSEKRDPAHPFRYSKEDMLRIYKEGGGKGGLGLEVERWEGIVREVGSDPVSMKEMGDAEKKIFAGPLNSEMRRRPSTDYMSLNTAGLNDRSKLNHPNTGGNSPMRERIGGFIGRRRDSADPPQLTLPRKLSQSSLQAPLMSPRDAIPSPRTRIGGATGFDGVLSDSWSVRRRASEGVLKPSARAGDTSDTQNEPKTEGIKEEEEETRPEAQTGGVSANNPSTADPAPVTGREQQAQPGRGASTSGGGAPLLSLNTQVPAQSITGAAVVGTPVEQGPLGPPPGIVDVNTLEWQYLDPQGQIQGPFPGATMQKWYDEGYFTLTLLMRRVNIDKNWMTVGELAQLAGNNRIFLTPLNTVNPPGFPRRDPLLDGPSNGAFGSPYHTAPTRSLLDGYHNGSVPPDSPASGFSAGRFSNDSPDPSIFGGRIGPHLYNDPVMGSRLAGFSNLQHPAEPQRRATSNEPLEASLSRPSYASFAGRTNSIDGLGFGGLDAATTSSADSPLFNPGLPSPLPENGFPVKTGIGMRGVPNNGHINAPSYGSNDYTSAGFMNAREGPRLLNRDYADRSDPQSNLPGQYPNGAGLPYQQANQTFAPGQPMPYATQLDTRSVHSISSVPERQTVGTPVEVRAQPSFNPSPSQSPWPLQEAPIRRPGPFDPNYPTARNTVAHRTITPITPSEPVSQPQTRPSAVSAQADHSPWFTASQGIVSNGWGSDPNSLTAANLGQHNRQQEQEELQQKHPGPPPVSESPAPMDHAGTPQDSAVRTDAALHAETSLNTDGQQPPQKSRRKASTPAASSSTVQPTSTKPAASPNTSAQKPPSPVQPTTSESKHAWSIDDDKKSKPTGAALGLREIQEMETKKLEAKKTLERERERAARAAAATTPSASEEVQEKISWGLPTSQVTARAATASRDSPALSSSGTATPGTPVWTGVPKAPTAKKTMKEIQEEEEKRKKLAKEKETVASAARRAYADSTTKTAVPPQVGGAWTTVGVGGKTTPVVTSPSRSAVSTVASTVSVKTSTVAAVAVPPAVASAAARNGTTTSSRPPAVPVAIKLVPVAKVEDTPTPPSHDFLKWMSENLKGLNSTVNMEEIMSMLLSFPLDPDSSTLELISDLIYANSTTLDGRRFASEFVNKRKADSKGSANGTSKPLSIAEVVKTQPKPAQNEWGGFKVVNKKKKGTRS